MIEYHKQCGWLLGNSHRAYVDGQMQHVLKCFTLAFEISFIIFRGSFVILQQLAADLISHIKQCLHAH